MVFGLIDIGLLILAVVVAIVLYKILHTVTHLVIHAIIGVIILFLAKLILGYNIAITWIVIVVVALGGSIGAIAIIILHAMGIVF